MRPCHHADDCSCTSIQASTLTNNQHADQTRQAKPVCLNQYSVYVPTSCLLAPMSVSIIAATRPVLSLPALQKYNTGRPVSTDSAPIGRQQANLSWAQAHDGGTAELIAALQAGWLLEHECVTWIAACCLDCYAHPPPPHTQTAPPLLTLWALSPHSMPATLTADVPQCCRKPRPAVF